MWFVSCGGDPGPPAVGRRGGGGLPSPQNLPSREARGGGKRSSVSGPDPRVPGLWTTWSRCLAPVLQSCWKERMHGDHPDQRFPQGTGSPAQEQLGRCSRGRWLNILRCTGRTAHHGKGLSDPQGHSRRGGEVLPWRLQTSGRFTDLLGPQAAKRGRGGWSCQPLAVAPGGLVLSTHGVRQRPSGSSWSTVPRWGEVSEALL